MRVLLRLPEPRGCAFLRLEKFVAGFDWRSSVERFGIEARTDQNRGLDRVWWESSGKNQIPPEIRKEFPQNLAIPSSVICNDSQVRLGIFFTDENGKMNKKVYFGILPNGPDHKSDSRPQFGLA
jgi:hypothetical protein